jgi:ubiquitin-protein ligase
VGYWSIINTATGAEVNLDTLGMYVTQHQGTGMPGMQNVASEYGITDGAFYQRTVVPPRIFTLIMHGQGTSLSDLHSKRAQLIDLLKPDRMAVQQPVELRYNRTGTPRRMLAVYDGGLELGEIAGFTEKIALRFVAHDPYWAKTTTSSQSLTVQQSVANLDSIAQRSASGTWSAFSTGMNETVTALAIGPDSTLYAGGLFTTAGGVTANRIAKWNGSAWSALGSGMDIDVNALAIGPDGTLYAGGQFTTAGGSTTNRIAKWNGSAWSALGSGMDSTVSALAIGPDGTLYAGGQFTTAGGVAANYIAKWNGSAWSALGSGMNGTVRVLAIGPDGTLYAGGQFTTAGGSTTNYIAKWNGSAWSALGSGMGSAIEVSALAIGPDGTLYAGGAFTTAGGVAANYIAKWNGSAWSALGSGMNGTVRALAIGPDGTLSAGGLFTTAGGLALSDRVAQWNGSAWSYIDLDLPDTPIFNAILARGNDLIFGYTKPTAGSAITGAVTSVTNSGSAATAPTLTLTGPGRVYQLINYATGERIFFNLVLNSGETATLDLARRTFTSSFRGNILNTVLPGSSIATFRLLPGANAINLFIGDATATASLSWRERYWSVD